MDHNADDMQRQQDIPIPIDGFDSFIVEQIRPELQQPSLWPGPIQQPASTGSSTVQDSSKGHSKPPRKQKRKQFSSCDTCRLRKIRCIKEDKNVSCNSCLSKGIICTNAFVVEHHLSKGKRIETARHNYGTSFAPTSATQQLLNEVVTSSHENEGSLINADGERVYGGLSEALIRARIFAGATPYPSQWDQTISGWSPNQNHNLYQKMLSTSTLKSFLRFYLNDIHKWIPVLDYERLFNACNNANFDISRLDDLDRILCLTVSTSASRLQGLDLTHPDAPQELTLDRRSAFSKTMYNQLLSESDDAGLMRKPSIRSMQALRIMCTIASGESAREGRRSSNYKNFFTSYAQHMRDLYDSGELEEPYTSIHFWSSVISDSLGAASSGNQPAFTADDFANYASWMTSDTQGMIDMIRALTIDNGPDVGWGLIFGNTCMLARQYCSKVSSTKARKRPFLDIEFMLEIPNENERLHNILLVYEDKLNHLFGEDGWPEHFRAWSKTARFLFNYMDTLCLDELDSELSRELSKPQPSMQRLWNIQNAFQIFQNRFIKDVNIVRQETVQRPIPRSVGFSDAFMSYTVVTKLRRILKTPSLEEGGGILDWPMSAKLDAAQGTLRIATAFGYAVEHIAEDLPALSSAVSDLVADARKRNLAVDDRNPQVTSAVAPSKAMTSLSNGSPSRYGLYVQPQAHVEPSSNVPPSFTDVWQALHPTRFEDVTEHVPVQLLQQQPTATMGNFPQPASLGTSPGSSAHLSPAVLDSLSSSTASASASTASSSGYTTLLEEAQQILPHIFPGQPLATPDLGTFAEYLNWDPADNPSFHDSL